MPLSRFWGCALTFVIGSVLGATILTAPGLAAPRVMAPPGGGSPTPSESSLDRQIGDASEQLDIIVEQYDAVKINLATTRAKLAATTTRLAPLRRSVAARKATVGAIAASVYRTSSAGTLADLLGAASTGQLVDRMSLVDEVARMRARQIDQLYASARTDLDEQKTLTRLTATQAYQYSQLSAERTAITKQISDLKSMRLAAYGPTGEPRPGPIDTYLPVFSAGLAGAAVRFAFEQIGKAYRWAAAGPNAYDCSGLTMAAWRSAGVRLPHNAAMQYRVIKHITRAEVEPGDLVFYFHPIHHVGIYIGGNRIINAPTYGRPVAIAPITMAPIYGYGRP